METVLCTFIMCYGIKTRGTYYVKSTVAPFVLSISSVSNPDELTPDPDPGILLNPDIRNQYFAESGYKPRYVKPRNFFFKNIHLFLNPV